MASISQNRTPIKKLPIAATPLPSLPIHGFFGLILLYIIIEWGRKIFNVLTSQFSAQSNYTTSQQDSGFYQKLPSFREDESSIISIGRDEVETILKKLGISCYPEGENKLGDKRLSSKDFIWLFGEEEEGGFEEDEVKAAFDVFDENKDGFIEAKELQRVLCALGLKEGYELENCRNMMKMFDEDGDGRIDFSEFCALF